MPVSKNDILKSVETDIQGVVDAIDKVLENKASLLLSQGGISFSQSYLPEKYKAIGLEKLYPKINEIYKPLGWKVELKHNSPNDNWPLTWLEFS